MVSSVKFALEFSQEKKMGSSSNVLRKILDSSSASRIGLYFNLCRIYTSKKVTIKIVSYYNWLSDSEENWRCFTQNLIAPEARFCTIKCHRVGFI
jgi:hypothetical protein